MHDYPREVVITGRIVNKFRAWRRNRREWKAEAQAAEPDPVKDWRYQGKSFRASDAAFDNTLSNLPADEGRPRH